LVATADGPFGADLSWQVSTDAVGVTGYIVRRNGNPVGLAGVASFVDIGLTSNTTYTYTVAAQDAAGNVSANSSSTTITTPPAPLPPLAALPLWMTGMSVGQWVQIPSTAISSVQPNPLPDGTNADSKVIAWTSFVMDTRSSKVYSPANGGHRNYAGNEVDMLNLESNAPAWVQLLAPTPAAQVTDCASYYSDGRPTSRHSYYGVTLNEFNDRIMLFAGANWCAAGGFHRATSSYNISANTWSASTTHPDLPNSISTPGTFATALDPLTGNVYIAGAANYVRWNRSSNQFQSLNFNGGPAGNESMSAFDTTRGRFFVLGGTNSDHHYYTVSSDSWTSAPINGANAADVSSAGQAAMVYVSAIDRFLVRLEAPGGTVYQVHPSTFEVTTFATTGGSTIPEGKVSGAGGPYNKFLYSPRLGGAVYVPDYSTGVWFLRTN
jgi:chitodextrinase